MKRMGRWFIPALACVVLPNIGCITTTVLLTSKLVGDVVIEADVEKRGESLVGESLASADEMFGDRHETLFDTADYDREIVVYPVKGELIGKSWWVIEAYDGKVLALTRKWQGGKSKLEKKVMGKGPAECQEAGELEPPIHVLESRGQGTRVRVYEGEASKLCGQKYEVLRFDTNDLCAGAISVEITGTTKKDK